MNKPEVAVKTFHADYIEAFIRLNLQWIETLFAIEDHDRIQLANPKEYIIEKGGEIFFVTENGRAVGTCAMVPHGEGSYDLIKMAVDPEMRGKGYGDLLIMAAKEWAIARGAKDISLTSNTVLEPAIRLYRKHGFETVRTGPHPEYQRCDIEMKLDL